jgi:hypothetical protein
LIYSAKVKRVKTIVAAFLFFSFIYAQDEPRVELATTNDKDGYTNVRSGPSASSDVVWKFHNGEIFYYSRSSTKNDWIYVYRDIDISAIPEGKRTSVLARFHRYCNTVEVDGYIHKSKIQPLSQLEEVNFKKRKITTTTLTLDSDPISVSLASASFDPARHKISMVCNDTYIDGRRAWGTDGDVPNKEISSLRVSLNGQSIPVPASEYSNLYEPNFEGFRFYLSKTGGILLHMMNSDGAAVYDAVFLIKNGKIHRIFVNLNPYV